MTDTEREFHDDGAAQLKAHLLKHVLLNDICSSGTDDERSDRVFLRVTIVSTRIR